MYDRRPVPVHANAREYDRWRAMIGGVVNPFVGSSSSPSFGSVAQTTLPVAGPVLAASARRALLGSTSFSASLTNTNKPGLQRCHIKSVIGFTVWTYIYFCGSYNSGGSFPPSTCSNSTDSKRDHSKLTTRYAQPTKRLPTPGRPRNTTLAIFQQSQGLGSSGSEQLAHVPDSPGDPQER